MAAAFPPSIVVQRVRSVLLVACPDDLQTRLTERIGSAGWIYLAVASLAEARRVLHEVRPALVLVATDDAAHREHVLDTLRTDPLVAGVPVLAMADGRPMLDEHWMGAQLDALRAGNAREVYVALDRLLRAGRPRLAQNLPALHTCCPPIGRGGMRLRRGTSRR